ncbi:hypothetical protein EDC01DRAFT_655358, partial [Geopyxis carbonaria]
MYRDANSAQFRPRCGFLAMAGAAWLTLAVMVSNCRQYAVVHRTHHSGHTANTETKAHIQAISYPRPTTLVHSCDTCRPQPPPPVPAIPHPQSVVWGARQAIPRPP